MNPDIEKCLTLIYEIEGLLHVMNHRSIDSLPASVKTLLARKSHTLAEMLSFGVNAEVQLAVETFEEQSSPAQDNEVKAEEADDSQRLAETVAYEQEEDSEPDADAADGQLTQLDEAQAEEDEADEENAEIEKSRVDYYGEIAQKKNAGSKLIAQNFTVNERFRYAIALFGGSLTAFNAIIDEVSTFASRREVADYLQKRQNIDINKGAGKEFFEILSRSFT